MAGELRGPSENGSNLAIWKPVTDAIQSLNTAGVSAGDLRGNSIQRQLALRQNAAANQAKEQLRGYVPAVDVRFAIDGTSSMADDTGPVQTTLPAFINNSLTEAFGTIPQQVQQQINPEREVRWVRINFGDGSSDSWGGFSRQQRIDNPYLTQTGGVVRFSAQDLARGASQITGQFQSYHPHMIGGGNDGESSSEAALAAMDLAPQNQAQLALLGRLLADCRSLPQTGHGRYDSTIIPYLESMLAGVRQTASLQQGAQGQGSDMLFLVTDEPAIGSIIPLEEVEALRLRHGLFAIITPQHVGQYWQEHAKRLGAQWFDLNALVSARASMTGLNLAQQEMAQAIQKQVAKVVAQDLSNVLQLTDGGKPGGTGSSIIRT